MDLTATEPRKSRKVLRTASPSDLPLPENATKLQKKQERRIIRVGNYVRIKTEPDTNNIWEVLKIISSFSVLIRNVADHEQARVRGGMAPSTLIDTSLLQKKRSKN